MQTYHSLLQSFISNLTPLYDEHEARSIYYYYIEYKFQLSKLFLTLNIDNPIPENQIVQIQKDLSRLKEGVPVQYLLGFVNFMDMDFEVNDNVLIPRQETEELIRIVLTENANSNLRVLDIGTGSGIIAISLKRHGNYDVFATDISSKALETAQKNANTHHLNISFIKHDILKDNISQLPDKIDILISNPPYIPFSEREHLHTNVKDFEPGEALFVPDNNPLIFYEKIALIGKKILTQNGKIYFETYHLYHDKMIEMLEMNGYHHILSIKDINEKNRFISACI